MKKKTFIVQLLDSKKPNRKSFTQVEDANFYSNDTDASLVFIPHEDTFDFQTAKVVMYNRSDESLVERDAVVTTENGRKVASYELPAEIIAHWGDWTAQPVFTSGGEIYSGSIVPFSVIRYLMDNRPPTLRDVIKVDELYSQLVTVMDEISDKDVISAPEIILARGGENTLGERLDKEHNEVTAQLAQTDSQINEVNYYNVGVNQKYKTLNEAFAQWQADGMPLAIIHVKNTHIHEYLNIGGLKNTNRLTIMGDDKHTNIWQYTDGRYAYAPFTGGGNITIKNFTVIADNDGTYTSQTGAYALHVDHPSAEGEVIIEDCILISYQDAALGSGTSNNQQIKLKNTELYHYAQNGTGRWHGALFYHTSNSPGALNQRLHLENVYAFSEKGPAIALQSSGQGDQDVVLTAIGVTVRSIHHEQYTGSQYDDMVSIANSNNRIILDKNSRNNNSNRLNAKIGQGVELTDVTGRAIQATDFNSVTFGFFRGENATNAPNNRAFVGFALRYSSDLIIQYAYDVLLVGVAYRRQNTGGTWSAWAQINDVGLSTSTATRPSGVRPGFVTFDTTIQKPIWWNGSAWKDANGTTV